MKLSPRPWFSQETIQTRIDELGKEISHAYEGKRPVVLGLLRGCVSFLSCLMRRLEFPFDLEFCQTSTYAHGTVPGNAPQFQFFGTPELAGRDILVVDDIVDTGATLTVLLALLKERGAASIRLCTLLDKPVRRKDPLSVDWSGFEIPDRFVVGFGMDHEGDFRGLPWIGILE